MPIQNTIAQTLSSNGIYAKAKRIFDNRSYEGALKALSASDASAKKYDFPESPRAIKKWKNNVDTVRARDLQRAVTSIVLMGGLAPENSHAGTAACSMYQALLRSEAQTDIASALNLSNVCVTLETNSMVSTFASGGLPESRGLGLFSHLDKIFEADITTGVFVAGDLLESNKASIEQKSIAARKTIDQLPNYVQAQRASSAPDVYKTERHLSLTTIACLERVLLNLPDKDPSIPLAVKQYREAVKTYADEAQGGDPLHAASRVAGVCSRVLSNKPSVQQEVLDIWEQLMDRAGQKNPVRTYEEAKHHIPSQSEAFTERAEQIWSKYSRIAADASPQQPAPAPHI